jgi:hypothetical protein
VTLPLTALSYGFGQRRALSSWVSPSLGAAGEPDAHGRGTAGRARSAANSGTA